MRNIRSLDENSEPKNLENLRKLYFSIRSKTNELLTQNDDDFVKNPSVNIETIAKEKGIKEITPVSPKEIDYEHAILIPEEAIIKINRKDTLKEKRFSIAHDLKHFLLKDYEYYNKHNIVLKKPYIVNNKPEVKNKKTEIKKKTAKIARFADKSTSRKLNNIYKNYFRFLSGYIAEIITNNIGRGVTSKRAINVLNTIYTDYAKNNNNLKVHKYVLNANFITDAINKLYDEETADYFAANLLIPTEYFVLWEDKSDRTIAKAFNVPVKCVEKRRVEIEYELDFLTPKSLSSDVIVENKAPLSLDELNLIMEGRCNHERRT